MREALGGVIKSQWRCVEESEYLTQLSAGLVNEGELSIWLYSPEEISSAFQRSHELGICVITCEPWEKVMRELLE